MILAETILGTNSTVVFPFSSGSAMGNPRCILAPTLPEVISRILGDEITWLAIVACGLLLFPRPSHAGTEIHALCWNLGVIGGLWVGLGLALGRGLRKATCRCLGILISIQLLQLFGSEVSELLVATYEIPTSVIPTLFAIALLVGVEALFGTRGRPAFEWTATTTAYRQTPAELWRVAVHEAGHAIAFSLLPNYPDKMRVFLRPVITDEEPEGGAVQLKPMQIPQHHAYAAMLISLAGLEAEHLILGARANGGGQDYADWISAATAYATAGHAGAFYRFPVTFWQRQINRDTIHSLQERQRADLRIFLASNRELLVELAEQLVAHGSVEHMDVIAYLRRVNVQSFAPTCRC